MIRHGFLHTRLWCRAFSSVTPRRGVNGGTEGLAKGRNGDDLGRVFERAQDMMKRNTYLSCRTFSSVKRGTQRNSESSGLLERVQDMMKRNQKPSTTECNQAIHACAQQRMWPEALSLLDRMQKLQFSEKSG
eukprot:GEMP01099671.1.p1 GENE.GEMP01099671.1~~GEMP01099671.1.p1  ORF type:complete len:132 (+),score=21.58 GEMP01099671.1:72-467(+)